MPTALEHAIRWRTLRAQRLAIEKQAALLKSQEDEIKQLVIDSLRNSKNKSISNGDRLIQLVPAEAPIVNDWPKLYAHIKKTGEFEFLHRRLNPAAVKERWEQGVRVPGVSKIEVYNLSDTQAK